MDMRHGRGVPKLAIGQEVWGNGIDVDRRFLLIISFVEYVSSVLLLSLRYFRFFLHSRQPICLAFSPVFIFDQRITYTVHAGNMLGLRLCQESQLRRVSAGYNSLLIGLSSRCHHGESTYL